MTRLTNGEYIGRPLWSPDGTRIVYGTRLQGPKSKLNIWQIAMRPADGSRDASIVLERERNLQPCTFTPDGKELIFAWPKADGGISNLWAISAEGTGEPRLILGGAAGVNTAALSPDGRWLAYSSNEGGQTSVFVRPFPEGEGRWPIATSGYEPRWSADGHELFFRDVGELRVVAVDVKHGFSPGRAMRVCDRVGTAGGISTYGIAPDGQRIFTFRSDRGEGDRTLYFDRGFGR
jgi:Tol biopolymer transport system component